MSSIDRIERAAEPLRIPSLPAAVEHIRGLLDDPEVDLPRVAAAFELDPPLSAKVLCVANSVQYGSYEKITAVHQAIPRLGLRTLTSIVLHAGLMRAFEPGAAAAGSELEQLWRHSILTAETAKALALRCRRRTSDLSPQDYHACGLLHDIGKIVLYDNLGDAYLELVAHARAMGLSLEEEEQREFGMRHSQVGHMAAGLWHLPEPIPSVIRGHHRPQSLGALAEVARLVACADEIANLVASTPQASPSAVRDAVRTVPAGLDRNGLTEAVTEAVRAFGAIEF